MAVFEPLAILAAIFAIISAGAWWQVVAAVQSYGGDAARVNRRLGHAATCTMVTLVLAGAAVLALPVAEVIVGLLA